MATYTTADLVRKQTSAIDAALTNDDIDEFIEEAEGILDAVMGRSFVATFDATKHKILRAGANKWAALCCPVYNPDAAGTYADASFTADVLWDQWQSILETLKLESTVRYLESL